MRRGSQLQLLSTAVAVMFAHACSQSPDSPGGSAGSNAGAGTPSDAGSNPGAGQTNVAGSTPSAGNGAGGVGNIAGSDAGGANNASGSGGSAGTTPAGGAAGTGAGGADTDTDPKPPRPLMIDKAAACNCDINVGGKARVDTSKTVQGKLVITLPGICGGPGGGGLEGTAIALGFHVFQPQTQSCVNSAPDKYKQMIQKDPNDPEANRQVGDARMELWDGVDRVDWVTVNKGESIAERTLAAIKAGMTQDPGGDWGYYLNADGTVRWSDVFILGYSWGAQTAAMISSYVRFGRVFSASGPQAEQFPNATWITHPSATPPDRKFMIVGFNEPYPSTDKVDTAPNTVTSMVETVLKAGWTGPVTNVMPGDAGPYTGKHIFAAVAKFPYDQHSPGGHGIFCNNDPQSGWAAMCKYVFLNQ